MSAVWWLLGLTGGGGTPAPEAPVNTALPVISPDPATVGVEATCTTGTWTGADSFAYQWMLDGGDVGTDANAYTPLVTGSLTCEVTATGAGGSTAATSAAVTVNPASSPGAYVATGYVATGYVEVTV